MRNESERLSVALQASRIKVQERFLGLSKRNINGIGDRWLYQNSRVKKEGGLSSPAYEETFAEVLQGSSIADLVKGRSSIIVMDLMSSTGTLADLFQSLPGIPHKRGIAVSLTDQRTYMEKERDKSLGIELLTGDLIYPKTWRNIRNTLGGDKANLILERGFGPTSDLPAHLGFYEYCLNQIWDMSSEQNSNMLLHMPPLSVQEKMGVESYDIRKLLDITGIKYYLDSNADTLRVIKEPGVVLSRSQTHLLHPSK